MRNVKIKGIYQHFKGDLYLVEDVGINANTLESEVIYRALYGNTKLWIRPLSDFLDKVDHDKYPNVKQEYKFELTTIESKRDKFI